MSDREAALRLLASKEAAGRGFFQVAARAIAIGLGCRWAGFGQLVPDGQRVEVIAFWDGSTISKGIAYDLDDSPCGEVYASPPEDPYRVFPDRVTELYSGPEILAQLGAVSYRGEAIFDSDGEHRGHVFAIDDRPLDDDPEAVSFFRLVGQRAGAEFNRQRAERALRGAKERAELANRAKAEFLANASHELRTPLNAVIGFSQILKDETLGPLGDERYREYAEHVHASGEHLLRIISDVLDLSKLEVGRIALYEDRSDVGRIVESAVSLARERAIRGKLALETELDRDLPPIEADGQRLKQLLSHLLTNAIKFTPAGGRVSVGAHLLDDGSLELRVRDSGIGIDPEYLPKVLEPFGQVEEAKSRQHEGLGLGLPLVKHIAELHEGTLEISRNSDGGTDAAVILPPHRVVRDQRLSAAG